MMSVIKFPIEITAEPVGNHHLVRGSFTFTCPACGTVSTFDFDQALFRSVEFFCGETRCGTPYRVINPAFSKTRP